MTRPLPASKRSRSGGRALLAGALGLILLGGCDLGAAAPFALAPDASVDTDGGGGASGLPCAVADVLLARCWRCHGSPLASSAPMQLLTRAQLVAPSYADPALDFAHRSLMRMRASTMPPTGGSSAADIQVIDAWVASGEPAGDCAPPDLGGPIVDMVGPSIDGGPPGNGLPCDVAQMLENRCASCHASPPRNGATVSLMTLADITARSGVDPSVDQAHRALTRMQAGTMPPGGGAAVSDVQTLQAWIAGGETPGSCGDGGIVMDPLNAAPACTSGVTATTEGDATMRSGEACISCHRNKDAPVYFFAGTVYPTGHEPDDCAGGLAGATVIITDANNVEHQLTVNATGNFGLEDRGQSVPTPYHARVVWQGRVRAMGAAQTSGDCNLCHTQGGSQGAPGRVTLPP